MREAFQVGQSVALEAELGEGLDRCVAGDATVTHKTPHNDGTCRIGVAFSPLGIESEESDEPPPSAAPARLISSDSGGGQRGSGVQEGHTVVLETDEYKPVARVPGVGA